MWFVIYIGNYGYKNNSSLSRHNNKFSILGIKISLTLYVMIYCLAVCTTIYISGKASCSRPIRETNVIVTLLKFSESIPREHRFSIFTFDRAFREHASGCRGVSLHTCTACKSAPPCHLLHGHARRTRI